MGPNNGRKPSPGVRPESWPRVALAKTVIFSALAGMAMLLASCGGSTQATPAPDPRIDRVLEKLDRLTEMVHDLDSGNIRGTRVGPTPSPALPSIAADPTASPTLPPTAAEPTASPTLPPTAADLVPSPALSPTAADPVPLPTPAGPPASPTPNPGNSSWVLERVDALINLYDFTDSGAALLRSLDLRQMRGEPGFFGSFGFYKWAGVGEARPIGVMHEVGHSYWGGFPIQGFPELSWKVPEGETISPAMRRYHADILFFMSQPPDHFEVLRQRLRNLPEVSNDNREPLFHSLEADMAYATGGDLALVPPILRKYWSRFLKEGPFGSWYDAVAWYQSLEAGDRTAANKYLGFEHLDLRQYPTLTPAEEMPNLLQGRLGTLAQEERQRLFDLADQFDLLLGAAQEEEKFRFWRGYLRDKVRLDGLHEGYLASLDAPRAAGLASALKFLRELSGLAPGAQARRVMEQLPGQPFLVNFLPALDNRTLLELFRRGGPLPEGATLQATASFVQRLERFSKDVEEVLSAARRDPSRGAESLREVVSNIGLERKEDLRLFFELLRDEDHQLTSAAVQSLDKAFVQRLIESVPVQIRFTLKPDELLAKLDVTVQSEISDLKQGIGVLIYEPSGNYLIDEPYLERMYDVVAERGRTQDGGLQRDLLDIVLEAGFPLDEFIRRNPREAAALLSQDPGLSAAGILAGDPVRSPPARTIHRLVFADPSLAARVVTTLEDAGNRGAAVDALAYLAYDKDRSGRLPQLPISLEHDGRFLDALALRKGDDWLGLRLKEAFSLFVDRQAKGEVPGDFLAQFNATLTAAAAALPGADARNRLNGVIQSVLREFPDGS